MLVKNIPEAEAELSSLIEAVLRGEEVIIGKAGKPVARLVPYHGAKVERVPGALRGKIRIADDFDAPLPEFDEAFGR